MEIDAITELDSEDWNMRCLAADKLGESGDSAAVEPLIAALRDKEWVVRGHAVQALGKLSDQRAIKPLETLLLDAEQQSWETWVMAMKSLAILGEFQATATLVLSDDDMVIREEAAGILGEFKFMGARESLERAAVSDPEDRVRRVARESIAAIDAA